jgi:hypothetical protein
MIFIKQNLLVVSTWHRYVRNLPGVLQPQFCLWIEESHVVHFIAMWVCTSLKLQSSYRLFQIVCGSWLQDEFVVECFFGSSIGNMHSWELWTMQALGRNHLFHLTKLCRAHSNKFNWWLIPWGLSILRSVSPTDYDLLLSYPSYPFLSLDAPKKEPLKLSLIEKLVEGDF